MDVPVHYWTKDPIQNFRVRVALRCVQAGGFVTGQHEDEDVDEFDKTNFDNTSDNSQSDVENENGDNALSSSSNSSSGDSSDEGDSSDDDEQEESLLGRQRKKNKKKHKKKKKKTQKEGDDNIMTSQHKRQGRSRKRGTAQREWSETFTWQEKKFGPRELVRYLGSEDEEGNAGMGRTAIEAEYLEQIARRRRFGEDLLQDAERVMLFTYTDKDGFVPKNEMTKFVTTSENFSLNPVAESIVTIPGTGGRVAEGREHERDDAFDGADDGDYASLERTSGTGEVSAGQRVFRESPFKVFYLMAAVDVDAAKLRSLRKEDGKFYEVVLCTVKVKRDGSLVEMQPGFSASPSTTAALRARTNDEDSGPPPTTWYRFKTPFGSLYEYSLINEAESLDPLLETEINTIQRENLEKVAAALEGRVPNALHDGPSAPNQIVRRVLVELVSAFDFDDAASDYLYVQYEVHLPTNARSPWTWFNGSREPIRGVTQTARARFLTRFDKVEGDQDTERRRRHTAHYCFPLELSFSQTVTDALDEIGHEQPKIFFQVKSRDTWERHRTEGYASVLLPGAAGTSFHQVRAWKVSGSLRQQVSEHFVGGALQLDSSMYSSFPQTHQGPFLNRYGFSTQTSGSLHVRINTVVHRHVGIADAAALDARDRELRRTPLQQMAGISHHSAQSASTGDMNTSQGQQRRRTVADILQSLRLGRGFAGSSAAASRTAAAARTGAGAGILASLNRVRQQQQQQQQQQE
ncbi:Meckel syndrome type 1 protein-like [Hondaea fermentalgiana]|uniref:Meckel syndrome type 1 protein-like n=1 Tax=Hondaea fermentalgiana TaxID=2315210 RepID=A0A2R5GPF1_9STRA|nr:Meckel syndrome type 1 protein-like [Hondaea fermentalgiana]|eukprot:GBG32495.1 Meckel syndrome type 1 protein-like [Hondaea fermentalgiana]